MHPIAALSTSSSREGIGALLAREIGMARLDQCDFLFNRVEAVVKNLLAVHLSPLHSRANTDNSCHYFNYSGFDPANPLTAPVTAGQKLAVQTLLGMESRKAQEVKTESLEWIRRKFDKVLDGSEQNHAQCFGEIWGFLRRLYQCGQGKVIAHFYAGNFEGDWAEQVMLELFIEETVEADFLAAKPEALELMAFAANSFSEPFASRTGNFLTSLEMFRKSIPVYDEELKDLLISRLASLGVPFAEDVLVDRALIRAEYKGEWSRFSSTCQKLAELGNSNAQKYFGRVLEEKLNLGSLSTEDFSKLEQIMKWFFEKCPITSCDFLTRVLESGKIGGLVIDLSAEERLDLLKRRFSLGDESAGSALSRIYVSNQIGGLCLALSPLERVEAITKLAESSQSCFVHNNLTNIYYTNRIGESPLSFSMEERYKRIEALAQEGSRTASRIMLFAYLRDRLSFPPRGGGWGFCSAPGAEKGLETLPLNLNCEERFEKLYALALAGNASAVDATLSYLDKHEQKFASGLQRVSLFRLLVCHSNNTIHSFITPPLGLNHNQMRIVRLLGSFYAALIK